MCGDLRGEVGAIERLGWMAARPAISDAVGKQYDVRRPEVVGREIAHKEQGGLVEDFCRGRRCEAVLPNQAPRELLVGCATLCCQKHPHSGSTVWKAHQVDARHGLGDSSGIG